MVDDLTISKTLVIKESDVGQITSTPMIEEDSPTLESESIYSSISYKDLIYF